MRLVPFVLLLACSILSAQEPSVPLELRKIRIAFPEVIEKEDPSKTVVHFVTNRLLVGAGENEPKYMTMSPHKMMLTATETPLVGYTVVKHNGSPDKANDASLKPFSIEEFHPMYNVRVHYDKKKLKPDNEVKDTGLSFLKNYWGKNVLIYFHGFNNDWQTAIKRAAQLKRDFQKQYKEEFTIIVYSWPSCGGTFGVAEYTADEDRYFDSLPAVATFLEAILLKDGNTQGRGKRWVLAHSMGNRVFLHGFATFGIRMNEAKKAMPRDLFTRIVLAAPDMEVKDFDERTKYVFHYCATAQPVMYFHAASNAPVNGSQIKHWDERAGVTPVVSDKLLTIDAQAAKSPWTELGHGYYASNDRMTALIADYFFKQIDPTKSPELDSVDGKRWKVK